MRILPDIYFRLIPIVGILLILSASIVSIKSVGAESAESGNEALDSSEAVVIAPRSTELVDKLQRTFDTKPASYQPRTEHFDINGNPRFINRLILEDSPYLQQHAHNPVDWHPWGPEAFAIAQRENKPIFLSIGYSTCHWCHVMERESFENLAIAKVLNQHFIAVKVDRERRPDVDKTYMNAVMLMTQGGGWPMNSFLTTDGKPFYGGTYFPPEVFQGLLLKVAGVWPIHQDELIEQAEKVANAVEQMGRRQAETAQLSSRATPQAVAYAISSHDQFLGGFGSAPKFPQEPLLFLLLDEVERNNNRQVLEVLEVTLDAMSRGGIYDQIGGGFHRYSVDNEWLVPHFEKMLYNQAHLARVYLKAWRLTGNSAYRRVATQTLDYVLRDMTSAEGAFYSATDADSEGGEGNFFLWTRQQIRDALAPSDAELTIKLFGITEAGNFEHSNIPNLPLTLGDFSKQAKIPMSALLNTVERIRENLYQAREKREHPLRDEKIITAWNGMMITTFSQAAVALDEPRYADAALNAARFIWRHNRKDDARLWRVHLDGSSSIAAQQQDYAYLAEAMLHIYDATGATVWLDRAKEVTRGMMSQFWDQQNGGFFMSLDSQFTAMGRASDGGSDSAVPSGNSVALRVLQMLSKRSGEFEYQEKAQQLLSAFAGTINRSPSNFGYMLSGANDLLDGELSATRYVARGNVTASARQSKADQIKVTVDMPKGWHINSNQPLQKELIATQLSLDESRPGWRIKGIDYPPSIKTNLGFQSELLSLYEGKVEFTVNLSPSSSATRILPLQLKIQACNDRICLPPEKVNLRVIMSQISDGLVALQ